MSIFKDITMTWKGTDYVIPYSKVMMLIAKVEDVIRLSELVQEGGPKLTQLSLAYMVILNEAGCKATHEDIYDSLFKSGAEHVQSMALMVTTLMIPPNDYNPAAGGEVETVGKQSTKVAQE